MPVLINVIIPLKLDWEPFYKTGEGEAVCVGDRVGVPFAGRVYTGVVSAVGVSLPQTVRESSVKEIYSVKQNLRRISENELAFWRKMSEYYMCTVGEVYKAACPPIREAALATSGRRASGEEVFVPEGNYPELEDEGRKVLATVIKGLESGRPVAASGDDCVPILLELCREANGNVLWLVPETEMGNRLVRRLAPVLGSRLLCWQSDATPARKRRVLDKLSSNHSGKGYVVLGNRSALLLPPDNLSLIIVSDEHDSSYKQTSSAPRYHGRDAAVLLSAVTGAHLVMTSATFSLDTEYNCRNGKFFPVQFHCGCRGVQNAEYLIVNTNAEFKKNGMVGDLSKKLIASVQKTGAFLVVYVPRRSAFPKPEELEPQLRSVFGQEFFLTDDLTALASFCLPESIILAVFGVDAMLGRSDFRADERTWQAVSQAVSICSSGRYGKLQVVIQTKTPSHPVFAAISSGDVTAMSRERQDFSLPPFTRLVDVLFHDNYPERGQRMARLFAERIRDLGICTVTPFPDGLRLSFTRDKYLISRKHTLQTMAAEFEKNQKYQSHISFDVDPQ